MVLGSSALAMTSAVICFEFALAAACGSGGRVDARILPSARLNKDADAVAGAGWMAELGSAEVPSSLLDAIGMVDAELALSNKDAADRAPFPLIVEPSPALRSLLALPPFSPTISPSAPLFLEIAFAIAGKNSLSLCGAPRRPPLEDS